MQEQVPKGLATWAGLIAAGSQYFLAVAVFLFADDQTLALGPLTTATGILVAVIWGRMGQAKALIPYAIGAAQEDDEGPGDDLEVVDVPAGRALDAPPAPDQGDGAAAVKL